MNPNTVAGRLLEKRMETNDFQGREIHELRLDSARDDRQSARSVCKGSDLTLQSTVRQNQMKEDILANDREASEWRKKLERKKYELFLLQHPELNTD